MTYTGIVLEIIKTHVKNSIRTEFKTVLGRVMVSYWRGTSHNVLNREGVPKQRGCLLDRV